MGKRYQFYRAYSKDHSQYTYWHDDGTKVTLVAGKDGITEEWIARLKSWHQEELNSMRRGGGKTVSLNAMIDLVSDHSALLVDHADPERLFFAEVEHRDLLAQIHAALILLTGKQRGVLIEFVMHGERVIAIAQKRGVTEATIRHQLRRAMKALRSTLSYRT